MKVSVARLKNFQALKYVEVKPTGTIFVIGGKNGSGKTSTLNGILGAIGGKKSLPDMAVRKGQDKASGEVVFDNGVKSKFTITSKGTWTLELTDANNMEFKSPQSVLDRWYSQLSFDPLKFLQLHPTKQVEVLKGLIGVDTSAIDREAAEAYEKRTDVGRELKRLEAQNAGMEYYKDAPAEPVDTTALVDELRQAQAKKEAAATHAQRVASKEIAVADAQKRVEEFERLLEEARTTHASQELELKNLLSETHEPIDTTELEDRIARASDTNKMVAANKAHKVAVVQYEAVAAEHAALEKKLVDLREKKEQMLVNAKFPVPGLSFTQDAVLYNDIPIQQCSAAEQLRTTTAILFASNPELQTVLIRDGSLLDDDSMDILEELGKKYDRQILLERVGTEGASIVIENGEVRGAQPVLAPQEASNEDEPV